VDAVPQDGVVDYLLEPAEPPEEEQEDEKPDNDVTEKKDATGRKRGRGGLVIFAVDVSGSMSSTTEVPALQGEQRNGCLCPLHVGLSYSHTHAHTHM